MKKFLSHPRVLFVGLIASVVVGLFATYYWFLNRSEFDYLAVSSGRTWGRAIRSDAVGYYSWIPTVFHEFPNLCFKNFADSSTFIQTLSESSFHQYVANSQCSIPPYTVGLSLMWLPMWIAVHVPQIIGFNEGADAISHLSNLDGFAIALSGAIFGIVGCIYLFKSLFLLIPTRALYITFVGFFGTATYHHSTFDSELSHSASFMLVAILMFISIRDINSVQRYLISATVILALIVLIRPTNILISVLILPALIQKTEITSLQKLVRPIALWFVVIALATGTFIVIQGTLWYLATGQVLINAYAVPSALGGFAISNIRNLSQILYGPYGLLMFSPVIGFALIGLTQSFLGIKKLTMTSIRILLLGIFVVITLWPASANRMGGWGSRMFVDFLPFFTIGLASLYERLIRRQRPTWPLSFALAICVCLNLFQMFSYWSGDWDNSRFLFNLIN